VPVEAEDQRDVHADAGGDGLGDRLQALERGGDLDHRVRAADLGPELARLRDRARCVVRQPGLDLDRHATVLAACRPVHGGEDVARRRDVVGRDLEDRGAHVGPGRGELASGQFPDIDAAEHYNMKFMRVGRDTGCLDYLAR